MTSAGPPGRSISIAVPRPDTGLNSRERQRRQRQIGADQHGRRQHRQRIVHEMTARRADLIGEIGAENLRLNGRAVGVQNAFDQARVGLFMLAERHDARDARFLGAAFQVRELRIVAVEHRGAARFEAEKNLRLGVGDFVERAEEFRDAPAQSW